MTLPLLNTLHKTNVFRKPKYRRKSQIPRFSAIWLVSHRIYEKKFQNRGTWKNVTNQKQQTAR